MLRPAWKFRMTDDQANGGRTDPLVIAKNWLIVFSISVGVFALTFSPLLAMTLPYLRAGWPAFQTGFWLRKADPWPARGRVGFWFHLAMAGFRAAVVGVFTLVATMVIAQQLQRDPDFTQGMIALGVILAGVVLSFSFGWWGTVIAMRHGIRIFVISDLKRLCQGDFFQFVRLPVRSYPVNPATYVMAVAIAAPSLALWFAAMLLAMPQPGEPDLQGLQMSRAMLLLALLPVLGVLIIVLLIFLSQRMIAQSPLECWGAVPPVEQTRDSHNWYRRSE